MANKLRQYIVLSGRTQKEIAQIIGTTQVSLTRYVKGDRKPDVYTAIRIAKILQVSVEDIWG